MTGKGRELADMMQRMKVDILRVETRWKSIKARSLGGTAHDKSVGDKAREAKLRWFGQVKRRHSEYIGRKMLRKTKEEINGWGKRGHGAGSVGGWNYMPSLTPVLDAQLPNLSALQRAALSWKPQTLYLRTDLPPQAAFSICYNVPPEPPCIPRACHISSK
ncbi:hypothetical protein CRENBAI_014143 [Crenichthys baileyi]|uniref:Uncharacterized protein n=1 Tax=Crenichthys baileyi TaxID=28760 RepID=A0AAV9R8E8_9TELE